MKTFTGIRSRVVVCLFAVLVLVAFSAPRCLADFTTNDLLDGTVAVGDGLFALGGSAWDDPSTSLTWDIDLDAGAGLYHYTYTFTAESHAVSHFILSVSDTFGESEILNSSLAFELGTFGPSSPSNPGMPGDLYSVKFAGFDEDTTWTWSFDSARVPVWGDFYAVDGKMPGEPIPYTYNTGFGSTPPITFDHPDGRLAWIARPDTTVVPVPGAVLLGMLGLGVAGVKMRKYV